MCIRDSWTLAQLQDVMEEYDLRIFRSSYNDVNGGSLRVYTVSYTHLRAHETPEHLVCRLLLEKKNTHTLHTPYLYKLSLYLI